MVALLFKSFCRCSRLILSLNARHLPYFAGLVSYYSILMGCVPTSVYVQPSPACAAMPLNEPPKRKSIHLVACLSALRRAGEGPAVTSGERTLIGRVRNVLQGRSQRLFQPHDGSSPSSDARIDELANRLT